MADDDDHNGNGNGHHDSDGHTDPGKPPAKHGSGHGQTVTKRERLRMRWRFPVRRYAQAEVQPADAPNSAANFSTGPGVPEEYHYHVTPTYHHQYAQDMMTPDETGGWENNPT